MYRTELPKGPFPGGTGQIEVVYKPGKQENLQNKTVTVVANTEQSRPRCASRPTCRKWADTPYRRFEGPGIAELSRSSRTVSANDPIVAAASSSPCP